MAKLKFFFFKLLLQLRCFSEISRLCVWWISLSCTLLFFFQLNLFENREWRIPPNFLKLNGGNNVEAFVVNQVPIVNPYFVRSGCSIQNNDVRGDKYPNKEYVTARSEAWPCCSMTRLQSGRSLDPSSLHLGPFIGNGTFGHVRWATYDGSWPKNRNDPPTESSEGMQVVVKKAFASVPNAKDYLTTEQYINHRLCLEKSHSRHVAPYMGHVTIKDEEDGTNYLVWKASGNLTLQDFIRDSKPQHTKSSMANLAIMLGLTSTDPHAIGREVLHQLLTALSYCHALGIVHRDIKPANVLVDPTTQSLQLIDFGSAADMGNWISQKGYRGTEKGIRSILYCAPEEFVQEQHPYAFDVYSVAVTWLRLMIPGLRDNDDDTFFNLRMSICKNAQHDLNHWLEQVMTSSSTTSPSLPDGWETFFGYSTQGRQAWRLITNMMHYDPAKRPSASESLLLQSYLNPMCSQTHKQPEPPPIPWSISSHLNKWTKLMKKNNNHNNHSTHQQDHDELCIIPEEFYGTVLSVEVNLHPFNIQFHPKPSLSSDTDTTLTTHHHGLVVSHAESTSSGHNHNKDNLICVNDTLLAIGPMDVDDWTLDHVLEVLDKWPRPTVQLQFLRTLD
jgi:serine/threonine protein kinase